MSKTPNSQQLAQLAVLQAACVSSPSLANFTALANYRALIWTSGVTSFGVLDEGNGRVDVPSYTPTPHPSPSGPLHW